MFPGGQPWAGRLFSLALSQREWMEAAASAILEVAGPPVDDTWAVLWDDRAEAGAETSAVWRGENGRQMALHFPQTTLPDARERVVRSVATTVTAAGLWTEASRDFFRDMGCGDALAVGAGDLRAGLIVGGLLPERRPYPAVDRRAMGRVLRSVSVALRARRCLAGAAPVDAADAILTPSGAVVHAAGAAATSSQSLQALRAAVLRRERERGQGLPTMDGDELWRELVCGRWSLVDDYEEAGGRYLLAVRNDAYSDTVSLSPVEARAIELSVLGRSPKELADELHISLSRTYAMRQSALEKLSVRSLGEVIGLARRLPGSVLSRIPLGEEALLALKVPAAARDLSALTLAERDVVRDLAQGVAQREIARRRGSSPRTIANQVRSIYRKLRVSDRNDLVAFLRSADEH